MLARRARVSLACVTAFLAVGGASGAEAPRLGHSFDEYVSSEMERWGVPGVVVVVEQGRFEEAMVAYERALTRHPSRFNSLYGAGRAAELSGDRDAAAVYYGRVVEQSVNAGEARPRVVNARAFSRR